MLPLHMKIDLYILNNITITAHILLCILHVGMDAKQYNHWKAPLRVRLVLH